MACVKDVRRSSKSSPVVLVIILSAAATIVSSTPVRRNSGYVSDAFAELPTYERFQDLLGALKSGHTISFTVQPSRCGLSTRPDVTPESHIGLTSRHWSYEIDGNDLNDGTITSRTIRIRNLHLEIAEEDDARPFWVEEELRITERGYFLATGEFKVRKLLGEGQNIDHFGQCVLGDGVVAMDMTGSSSEEMVPLGSYDFLRDELLSGRQVSGYINMTSCGGLAMTDKAIGNGEAIQGITVETYFVENYDRSDEQLVMVAVWPEGAAGRLWHKLRIIARRGDISNGGISARAYLNAGDADDSTSANPDDKADTKDISGKLQCDFSTTNLKLFTRRFDSEKTYGNFTELEDGFSVENGHKFHIRMHEDYCLNENGLIAGNKVFGQSLRTWEWENDLKGGPSSATFYQMDGDHTGNFVRGTRVVVLEESQGDIRGNFFHAFPSAVGSTVAMEDMIHGYLDTSAFMRSPVNDETSMMDLQTLEFLWQQHDAIPLFSAAFKRLVYSPSSDWHSNRRRMSFSSARWQTDKDGDVTFVASSEPILVLDPISSRQDGISASWMAYTLSIDFSSAQTLATLKKLKFQEGGLTRDPSDGLDVDSWTNCTLSQQASQQQAKKSFCFFALHIER